MYKRQSVRRVEDITEALWGSKVSPATISELNKKAYVHIEDWRNRENVAVKMHRAALIFGVRKHLAHGLQHPHALVPNDELYAVQAASAKPLEETDPADRKSTRLNSSHRL